MKKKCAPINNVFYRNANWHYPKITHAKGIYLFSENGKEYIDGCSGSTVANIGHGNEEVAECAYQQIKQVAFTHLSRFTTQAVEDCATTIADMTPGDLNHVYFVSGGSESTETALKLARQYYVERDKNTNKHLVISRWNSFHGNTIGSLSMTGINGRRKVFEPILAPFPKINQAYCYRCPYKSTPSQCEMECAYELEEAIQKAGGENVMAFIAEPIIGSAAPGIHPPKEYFKIIRDICSKHDILLIVDEVMMGFGRTGKIFGIDHYEIVPDIITVAKGLSSGYTPLGAAITNDEIFETIMINGTGHFIHGHTYGGNPLSAQIANQVLKIMQEEDLVTNARKAGDYLLQKLQTLYKYPIVGDVRGKGLMSGIEFVKDQNSKEPFAAHENIREKITVNCMNEGLIVYPGGGSVDGTRGDHILIAPPINISMSEIDLLFSRLERGIQKTLSS